MFRLAYRGIARASAQRSISTSTPRLVRIRHSNPDTPPSPAERPPAPPKETTPSAPFEPQVSTPTPPPQLGTESEFVHAQTPLEQPSPDAIPEKPDFTSLPSLDIDPDVALPEPGAEEGKERKRTGAKEREYVSSMERQRRAYLRFLLGATVLGGVGGAIYLGQSDTPGESTSWWQRVTGNAAEVTDVSGIHGWVD